MAQDYYDILGVSKDASEEEIKKAYREKARKYHPDTSDHENAQEKFKKIKKAYEVLSDEDARQAYDRMGHERFEQAEKQGFDPSDDGFGGFGGGGRTGRSAGFEGFSGFEDIFNDLFGGSGGFGGFGRQQRSQRGSDVHTTITISLEEAFKGADKEVTFTRSVTCDDCGGSGARDNSSVRTCPQCNGSGQMRETQRTAFGRSTTVRPCSRCDGSGKIIEDPCPTCNGSGEVNRRETRTITIPRGVEDGTTLQVRGGGNTGERGEGDLLIEVNVREHDKFKREGTDILYTHPISFPQAVFGDEVQVPTIDGEVKMDIPAGTQSGETFRLRDKGMPPMRGSG
ncbi:MAG: molecular chaperone DnaJ, partial [Halobacteria archaeon]|nr:molecular chaperone DnaJ [Halobacteria archaeon]